MAKKKYKTYWDKKSTTYCRGDLIRTRSIVKNLEMYTFKKRAVFEEKEELKRIFTEETKGKISVYFLYSSDAQKVYTGQSEESYLRILKHHNNKDERYYNDWDEAILFTTSNDEMTADEMDALEAVFIKVFKSCVDTSNTLNRKQQKIRKQPLDINDLKWYADAIHEQLVNYKLIQAETVIEVEDNSIEDAKTFIKEAAIEVKEELKKKLTNTQEMQVSFLDKQLKYDDLRERVSDAEKLIVRNRIITSTFNKRALTEVITPVNIAKYMVDMIPKELFSSKTKFLDPAVKSGIYLNLILNKLMSDDPDLPINKESGFSDKLVRLKHIIENQLYGIAVSLNGLALTQNTLLNTIESMQRDMESNGRIIKTLDRCNSIPHIVYIEGYKSSLKTTYKFKDSIMKAFRADSLSLGENMKFDVIIGNPPYQDSNGGGNGSSASALYHQFIDCAEEIANQVIFIIPARWMSDKPNGISDKELLKMRTRNNIRRLIDFKAAQPFVGANIAGGVCILHLDNSNTYPRRDTLGVILRDEIFRNIIPKVINNKFESLSNYITSDCFRSADYMNSGWQGFSAIKTGEYSIKYYCSEKDSILGEGYVSREQIIKNHNVVDEYKVAISSASPTDGKVIYTGMLLEPNTCCSRTYIVIHDTHLLNTEERCNNLIKYLKTKFARACIKAKKNTQNASAGAYKFVPLQDFNSTSDIDWTQPTSEIDKQLYAKYNLTQEEVDYIEKTIKSLSTDNQQPKLTFTYQEADANLINMKIQQNQNK